MRYVPMSLLKDGMPLGQDVYDGTGRMLLAKHLLLNNNYITTLEQLGFPGAYIDDEFSAGLEIVEIVRPEIKREALQVVSALFQDASGEVTSQSSINDLVMKVVDSILDNGDIMCNMMDLKKYDDYTYFHSVNVAVLSAMIGAGLGLGEDELQHLTTAAMLHDIGKKFIDSEILSAERSLTVSEMDAVREHPRLGCEFLRKNYAFSAYVYSGILEHHEWYSGEGYPLGKKKDEIPLHARIIKLVDVYDALISKRPYHEAESPSDAVEYLMAMNGREFDPMVLDMFLKRISVYPIGCQVEISDGRQAIVTDNYCDFILRPKIKLLESGDIIDLKDDPAARKITVKRMVMQ
ncbi:MAG: HD-GYP domain-containing protein [Lachnospiraceae bacterium]